MSAVFSQRDYFELFFSKQVRKKFEKVILILSIAGFFIHLLLVLLYNIEVFSALNEDYFGNPINAIYTPFSFILVYEIYLLIFFIPRSFTTSLLKQYEIIALVLIRRIFGDLTKIDFEQTIETNEELFNLGIDILAVLLLLAIVLLFSRIHLKLNAFSRTLFEEERDFIFKGYKKKLSVVLLLIIVVVSCVHLVDFINYSFTKAHLIPGMSNNLNSIFYKDFFTLLILADVLVLLFSYGITQENFKLLRNTGFIIATILMRISFSATGVLNVAFILAGSLFGYLILLFYFKFVQSEVSN
ncbi:MAG: hypothetical protein ACPGYU_01945 [Flavobacteriaceae bacterium]